MHSAAALLSRRPHQPPPSVTLGHPDIALALGRVHELCGSARRTLALALAARAGSPVIWIGTNKGAETLNADGISDLMPPGALVFVQAERSTAALWAMEEALRSGTAPVVIADLQTPPAMTPVRRLHLAAETGCGVGQCRPLALLLTPDTGGAPGIETRWALHPAHQPGRYGWTLDRLRARMAPPRSWMMGSAPEGLAPFSDAT
jgi:protein ImuA